MPPILSNVFETHVFHGFTCAVLQRWNGRQPGEWIWSYVVLAPAGGRLAEEDHVPTCELARAGAEREARAYAQLRDRVPFIPIHPAFAESFPR